MSVFIEAHLIPLDYTLEVKDIAIQLDDIHLRIVELYAIPSFSHSILIIETIYKGFVITTLSSKVIQRLIIVDPESNIPGFIILPTIIGNVESIGLIGCGHCGLSIDTTDAL
jgi:hypothetical protein